MDENREEIIDSDVAKDPLFDYIGCRIAALNIAKDIALSNGHFKRKYVSKEDFFNDLDYMYEIADHHMKYISGER